MPPRRRVRCTGQLQTSLDFQMIYQRVARPSQINLQECGPELTKTSRKRIGCCEAKFPSGPSLLESVLSLISDFTLSNSFLLLLISLSVQMLFV